MFDRFEFEKDGPLDDDVSLEGFRKTLALVDKRKGYLAFSLETVLLEFPEEALIVDGFQEARAEFPVHLNGEADDRFA